MLQWLRGKRKALRFTRRAHELGRLRNRLTELDPRLLHLSDAVRRLEAEALGYVTRDEARSMATRGRPMLIDLQTGGVTAAEAIGDSALGTSLARLSAVGTGVIIYHLAPDDIRLGNGTELRDFAVLEVGGRLEIGDDCVIGAYTWFQCTGTITLGAGVIVGPHCCVVSSSHERPGETSKVRWSPLVPGRVTIGDNVWIGANVTILAGVRIGRNAVIGAGSVVTRDVPDSAIAFGSPCRVHEGS